MNDFEAYYWRISDLRSRDSAAGKALCESDDRGEIEAAFEQLLRSDHVVARGVALDQFSYARTQDRYGAPDRFADLGRRALEVARAELARPAVTSTTPRGGTVIGANHASALGALRFLGDASDLEAIAPLLFPTQDLNVVEEACMAASHCLEHADGETSHAIGAKLAQVFRDPNVLLEARIMAISPFRKYPALEQDAALLETLVHDALPMSAYAAWALVKRDPVNPEVRPIVATWPADAPYPAGEVRNRLNRG